jgi:hypothetical protein
MSKCRSMKSTNIIYSHRRMNECHEPQTDLAFPMTNDHDYVSSKVAAVWLWWRYASGVLRLRGHRGCCKIRKDVNKPRPDSNSLRYQIPVIIILINNILTSVSTFINSLKEHRCRTLSRLRALQSSLNTPLLIFSLDTCVILWQLPR